MEKNNSIARLESLKERLKTNITWFPMPALISFTLALVFVGHLLVNLNPRLGNPVSVLTLETNQEISSDGSIWISVGIDEDEILITTNDRQTFRWEKDTQDISTLNKFSEYLERRTNQIIIESAISKVITEEQLYVTLAVDQTLRYFHLKPILNVLAKNGLDYYGFEIRDIINTSASGEDKQAGRL